MVLPDPSLAPVIPPVTVPTFQLKVLRADAAKLILTSNPLQMVLVFAVVTTGKGLTVTVMV